MNALRIYAALLLTTVVALSFVACGEGESADAPKEPTPTAGLVAGSEVAEIASGPVYWRTQDGFESLTANQSYKVVARVTNGYAEPTLRIVAEPYGPGQSEEFQATIASPGGPDAEGSYYVFSLDLPTAGSWQISAYVAAEPVTVLVEVDP
jgi:hypothetical protein